MGLLPGALKGASASLPLEPSSRLGKSPPALSVGTVPLASAFLHVGVRSENNDPLPGTDAAPNRGDEHGLAVTVSSSPAEAAERHTALSMFLVIGPKLIKMSQASVYR